MRVVGSRKLSMSASVFFFFKQKTAYEILSGLVGSEMCIRGRACTRHAISAPRVQWGDGHGVGNLQDSGSGPVTGRINVSDPRGGLEQSVQRFAPFRDTGV